MTEVKGVGFPYTIQPIDINKHDSIPSFWDFKPSWQNSMDSVNRSSEGFIGLGVFTDNKLIGYGIFEPASGDITQIAVDKTYRRKGVGSLLFHNMIKANKLDSIKIINTDIRCDSMNAFLQSKNIEPTGKQFEMIKKL